MSMSQSGLSQPLPGIHEDRTILARLPMPQPRRASRVATQLSRGQILDATLDALRQDGYDRTTIRNIARRLDCAVGSIYRYFADKRTLLDAVTQREFEPLVGQLEAGASLDTAARGYVQIAQQEPEMYRLMFWLQSVGRADASPSIPPVIARILDHWADRLQGDLAQAQRFWSQLHGSLMLGLNVEMDPPAADPAPTPVAHSQTVDDVTLL